MTKMVFYIVTMFISSLTFALQPPNCSVIGSYKEYYKEGDKTRTRDITMKINYQNSTQFPWTKFDFGQKGKLHLTIGIKGRSNTLVLDKDDGSLQSINLLKLIQILVSNSERHNAYMNFKFWYNNMSYCMLYIENLKAYK